MLPDLPSELCDIIIDHLWDDPSALAACSLVCCAWVPTTRLHKLRAVTLRTPARCLWLETLLDSPLVNSADIPLCVGELTVGANPNDTQYDSADTGAVWEHPGLVPLLCRFARVQCLRLDNLKWSPGAFPARAARQFMAAFPRLKRLVMKVAVFHSPEDLLLLLSAFPLLTSVAVSFVSWFNQDVVTHWTTSPRRPRKQSSEPIVLSLKSFTTDPTSYIAVITAASVSQNTWRLALDELEWIGHEKFHSDWMLARAYEQSAAFINPLSDITAHLFAVEGRGLLDIQPSLVSRLNLLHINITTMPGPQSWNSARVIPVSALDIREIRYTLGTVHASSVFTELGGRLAWMFLDRYLTSLLADHPHLVPNFNLDIDFDGEHADWHASLADIEDSFDMNLPMMVENGSRMCAIVQFSVDETGRPGKFYREIRWPKEPVATTPAGVQPDASTTG